VTFGIIHRHQGRIETDPAVEEGTTFRVILPRQPAAGKGEQDVPGAPVTDPGKLFR